MIDLTLTYEVNSFKLIRLKGYVSSALYRPMRAIPHENADTFLSYSIRSDQAFWQYIWPFLAIFGCSDADAFSFFVSYTPPMALTKPLFFVLCPFRSVQYVVDNNTVGRFDTYIRHFILTNTIPKRCHRGPLTEELVPV